MNWVPLISERPSFACSRTGVQAGRGERLGARHANAVDERLSLADERQREMSERREIAARAHRAARRDVRDDPGVEHREQELDGLDAGAGIPLGDRVGPQHHRRADDVVGIRLADATRVAAQEPQLQLLGLVLRDRLRHEAAEAGVDAVGVLATQIVEQRPRAAHLLDRARRQSDRATADRDVVDVVDREVISGQQERLGHGPRVYGNCTGCSDRRQPRRL